MKILGRHIEDNSLWKGLYTTTLFLGLVLAYFGVNLFRKTFIDINVLIAISFIIGLLTFMLIRKHYGITYNFTSIYFPLMQSYLSSGLISIYLLLAINYYFSDSSCTENILRIESKSSIPSYRKLDARQPTIKVIYKQFEKELVFYSSENELVENAMKIKLKIRRGALGFEIIDEFQLINENNNQNINNR